MFIVVAWRFGPVVPRRHVFFQSPALYAFDYRLGQSSENPAALSLRLFHFWGDWAEVSPVIIISRNLTFENSQTRERQSRNFDISLPSSFRFSASDDQGGPPGSVTGPLSHCNGAAVATQRGPRDNPVRPLQQKFSVDFIAHFR